MKYRVEPEAMPVDTVSDVRVSVKLDRDLGGGQSVSFALPEAWTGQRYCPTYTRFPQFDDPTGENYVQVQAEGVRFEMSLEGIPLPAGVDKGHVRKIKATLVEGRIAAGDEAALQMRNYRSAGLAEAGTIRIWIDEQEQTDTPKLKTLPGEAELLRLIVPSCAKPGEPFTVNVVSLDAFWNLSSSSYRDGVLGMDGGKVLEEGISFTGSYRTTARIAASGVHRLRFADTLSNPIRITDEPRGPYWGDLHSHDKTHNCGTGEDPYTYAKEVASLDFVAVVPDYRAISRQLWEQHVERCNRSDDPGCSAGNFTAILGYEVGFRGGHHNVYFKGSDGYIFDVADSSLWSLDKLLPHLDPEQTAVVPHHLGIDWSPHAGFHSKRDPWIPLLEIYSQHGQSEFYSPEHALSYEYNRTRRGEDKYATSVEAPIYARDAWAQGRRYGTIASSDNHFAQPGKPVKGLAAIFAPANTREALFAGMKARSTYGTTGERILLDFRINGCDMGGELFVPDGTALTVEVEVHGTDNIAFVEVMRCRFADGVWERAFHERIRDTDGFHENPVETVYDFEARFEEDFTGDAVYYLRVGQRYLVAEFPVFAWSSPIWVTRKI